MKFEIYLGIAVGSAIAIGFRQVDMASALLAGVLLFELVMMGAERLRTWRSTRIYRAKFRMLRKAWADAAPSTRREGPYRSPPRWERPTDTPKNLRVDDVVQLRAPDVRIVHVPSGAVEVLWKGDR